MVLVMEGSISEVVHVLVIPLRVSDRPLLGTLNGKGLKWRKFRYTCSIYNT